MSEKPHEEDTWFVNDEEVGSRKYLWAANKRLETSKCKFKFPRARNLEIIGLVLGCIEANFCKGIPVLNLIQFCRLFRDQVPQDLRIFVLCHTKNSNIETIFANILTNICQHFPALITFNYVAFFV